MGDLTRLELLKREGMPLTKEEISQIATRTADEVMDSIGERDSLMLHSTPCAYGSPGVVVNKDVAKASPCRCIEYRPGKKLCFSKGIIGALSDEQEKTYCPTTEKLESPGLEKRLKGWMESVDICKADIAGVPKGERLEPWLSCMSRELAAKESNPSTKELWQMTELVGNLEKGAWVQFKPEGIMYQITDVGRARVTLVDGEGNITTIPLRQAVYPLEAKPPIGGGSNPGLPEPGSPIPDPWLMTRTEWLADREQTSIAEGLGWSKEGEAHAAHLHKRAVQNALAADIHIPPEVLADYPELAKTNPKLGDNPAPKVEKVKCPIDLKPMAKWVSEEDPKGSCRECMLGPVVQWYDSELKTKGHEELAKELTNIAKAEDTEPLQLCEKLDKIKDEVEKPLRERLLDFDCSAQAYEPDD